jgi:prepilin-type processing-associated H-X9-DG protein
MYATDFDETFPISLPARQWNTTQGILIGVYLPADQIYYGNSKTSKVLDCPSNPARIMSGNPYKGPDYVMNYYMFGDVSGPTTKLSKMKILVADGRPVDNYFRPWLFSAPTSYDNLSIIHTDGLNMGWTDGHVAYMPKGKIPPIDAAGMKEYWQMN